MKRWLYLAAHQLNPRMAAASTYMTVSTPSVSAIKPAKRRTGREPALSGVGDRRDDGDDAVVGRVKDAL